MVPKNVIKFGLSLRKKLLVKMTPHEHLFPRVAQVDDSIHSLRAKLLLNMSLSLQKAKHMSGWTRFLGVPKNRLESVDSVQSTCFEKLHIDSESPTLAKANPLLNHIKTSEYRSTSGKPYKNPKSH